MLPEEYHDKIFDEIFDNVFYNTKMQAIKDPEFTLNKLEALLNSQYEREGQNPDNSGSANAINISATIAAFDAVLAEWRDGVIIKEAGSPDA